MSGRIICPQSLRKLTDWTKDCRLDGSPAPTLKLPTSTAKGGDVKDYLLLGDSP